MIVLFFIAGFTILCGLGWFFVIYLPEHKKKDDNPEVKPTEPMNGDPSVLVPDEPDEPEIPEDPSINEPIDEPIDEPEIPDTSNNTQESDNGDPSVFLPPDEPDPVEDPSEGQDEDPIDGPSDDFDNPLSDEIVENELWNYLEAFKDIATITKGTKTYDYFFELFKEAIMQYFYHRSFNSIPSVVNKENFPTLYEFGEEGSSDKAIDTLVGWLFALQLAELKPSKKTSIFKIGYELGGYDKYSNIYGYKFAYDPNLMRIVAAAIYAAMRGTIHPDVDAMRSEIGGTRYSKTLEKLNENSREAVGENDFFTDFREFLPTAPGPYAPSYKTRPDNTYPGEEKDENKNLKVDRDVHEMVVERYNLDNDEFYQETVQAIADKEADKEHLFGPNRVTDHFHFHPVFGKNTIEIELDPDGDLGDFVTLALSVSSRSRGIMQGTSTTPKQYGRLRPGCSWKQEAKKNSSDDDRRNILTNIEIEDGDGSPTGYYDKKGNWVYKDAISSPAEFEESQKNALWANSYPSGHSSGIIGGAMVLIELMPERADLILKAANQYAVNRTIARYHWTSDTLNGRVLGTATNAVAHAAKDYDELLAKCKKEIEKTEEDAPIIAEILGSNPGSFTYAFGGSECTCTADKAVKSADRKCHRYRSPVMTVSETVSYRIEAPAGYDISVNGPNGSTEGTFLANVNYVIYCAALPAGEERFAKIILSNSSGTKVINYRLWSPSFTVNYKNETGSPISGVQCRVMHEDGIERMSTYKWTISAGKEKSDAWIDNDRKTITSVTDVTVSGKTVKFEVKDLNTSSVTVTIK